MKRGLLVTVLWLSGLNVVAPPSLGAQATDDAYLDPAARELYQSAAANWQDIDESVVRYTALIRQRIAARLRTPLKDRTLYRNESAARVMWDRDHPPLVQVLGARAQYPGREIAKNEGDLDLLDDLTIDGAFDPGGDKLIFGVNDEDGDATNPDSNDFWFAHPLAPGADTLYQFRSGDTLTLTLPDGRTLTTVRLDVLPRIADVHRLSGTLWIEPETGALVRAVYRLASQLDVMRDIPDVKEEDEDGEFKYVPGLLKPWTLDLNLVAVDYTLWNFRVWLPRSMRLEGEVAAGILKMPVSFDLAYRMETVVTEDDLADLADAVPVQDEVHFRTRSEAMAYMAELASRQGVAYERYTRGRSPSSGRSSRFLVPQDPSVLEDSPDLPPPIWDDAPGFQSEEELSDLFGTLADLPQPAIQGIPWAANWGWQRPDLIRYNRVEGPSVGGRFQARLGSFAGPLSFEATGFFGLADLEPKARLSLERESLRSRVAVAGYRDLRTMDPQGRYLGFGNSLNALLFGRDDGEYYLATGAELSIAPPSARRDSWRIRLYAERQDAADVHTNFSLAHAFDSGWRFRDNLEADLLEEAGAQLSVSPWWGTDPLLPQFGFELGVQGAATRDVDTSDTGDYARARLVLRSALPLAQGRWRVGLEAGGGTSWGDVPVQRQWVLGGPLTLRGYGATSAVGTTYGRARMEVARVFPAWTLTLFGDGGWAGDRSEYVPDDVLWGVGAGASLLDGLIRFDISRGLTGPLRDTRVDLYLDAIL